MTRHIRALRESFLPLFLILVGLMVLSLYMDARAERIVESYKIVKVGRNNETFRNDAFGDDGMDAAAAGVAVDKEAVSEALVEIRSLADKGRFELAKEKIDAALAADPSNPVLLNEAGVTLLRLNAPDAAAAAFTKAVARRPDYFRAFYNRAIAYRELKRDDEARADYETAVTLRPNHFESSYNLGLLLMAKREYGTAATVLKRAAGLASGASRASALFSYARAEAKLGRKDLAVTLYQKAIEYQPAYVLPRLNLAILLSDTTNGESLLKATKYLDDVIALRPDFAPGYFVRARIAAKQGKPSEAIQWYLEAEKADPTFWKARHNLALAYIDSEAWQQARRHLEKMAEDFPKRPEVDFNLGKIEASVDNPEAARRFYQSAIDKSGGDYPEAALNLSSVLKDLKAYDDALAVLDGLLEKKPVYAPALLNKALVLIKKRDYRTAESLLFAAAKHGGDRHRVYFNLGRLYRITKQDNKSIDAYREALKANPRHLKSAVNLGVMLSKRDRLAEAEAAFRSAVALDPSLGPSHLNLAMTLRKQKKWQEAAASYRTVVALDPANESAWLNLGFTLSKLGNAEEAVAVFRELLEMNPAHVKARYNLAFLYRKLGRTDQSESELRQVLKLDPSHLQSHITLAKIALEQGRRSEAQSLLLQALKLKPGDDEINHLIQLTKNI